MSICVHFSLTLAAIVMLNKTSIDLIELSGGSYFPGAKSNSDSSSKGPYFVDFAVKARRLTRIPLVVIGGFKTRQQILKSQDSGDVDFIGLARAWVINPELANDWLTGTGSELDFPVFEAPRQGGITAWYTMFLTAIGNDSHFNLDLLSAIIHSRIIQFLS